jgi:hypothetical protein
MIGSWFRVVRKVVPMLVIGEELGQEEINQPKMKIEEVGQEIEDCHTSLTRNCLKGSKKAFVSNVRHLFTSIINVLINI